MNKKSLILVLLIIVIASLSACGGSSGSRSVPSGMAGTWINTSGLVGGRTGYAPYTVIITRDYLHFIDKDGDGVHIAYPIWTQAENPREDTRGNFPTGFTLSGDVTIQYYDEYNFFVAQNRSGQILLNMDAARTTGSQIILNQTVSSTDRAVQTFHGTWEMATTGGRFVTISQDNFHLTDGVNTWTNMVHPIWFPAQNPREDTRADFPEGFYFFGDETDSDNRVVLGSLFFVATNERGQMLLFVNYNPGHIIFDKTSNSTARPATAPAAVAATSPAPFANRIAAPAASAPAAGGGTTAPAQAPVVIDRVAFEGNYMRVYSTDGRNVSQIHRGFRGDVTLVRISGNNFVLRQAIGHGSEFLHYEYEHYTVRWDGWGGNAEISSIRSSSSDDFRF